jgi:hypothetical protein
MERALGAYWIGGWVDARSSLEAVMERKIPNGQKWLNIFRMWEQLEMNLLYKNFKIKTFVTV